jgi:hypothetical protein
VAAVRHLPVSPERGPVLVLGTLEIRGADGPATEGVSHFLPVAAGAPPGGVAPAKTGRRPCARGGAKPEPCAGLDQKGRVLWHRFIERLRREIPARAGLTQRELADICPLSYGKVAAAMASPLGRRPYDLRRSALSTWLNAGVDPTEVAERAGNSVEVLLRPYTKCLDRRQEVANRRTEDLLREYE